MSSTISELSPTSPSVDIDSPTTSTTSSDQSAIHQDLDYEEEIAQGRIALDSPIEDRYRFFPGYGDKILPSRRERGKLSWIGNVLGRIFRFLRPSRKRLTEPISPRYPLSMIRTSDPGVKGYKGVQITDTSPVTVQIHPEPGGVTFPSGGGGGGGDMDSSTKESAGRGPLTSSGMTNKLGNKVQITISTPTNLAQELTRDQDIMDDRRRFYKWYQLVRSLNSGTFSRVYLAYHKFSGEFVAVKKIDKNLIQEEISRTLLEIEALKVLDHPNICKLYQTFDTEKYLLIVLEVCRGDLFDVINKHSRIKEHLARKIFAQIASAVDYMHSKGWVHRDLKPENVLFDPNGNVKLIDFNLSARITYKGALGWNKLGTHCGTLEYAAPELVRPDKTYEGPPVDSWSLGVLLYTMLAGKFPFEEPDRKGKILRGVYQPPSNLSFNGRHLLIRLLNPIPKNRLTPGQILTHPWITAKDNKHPNFEIPSKFQNEAAAAASERDLVEYLSPQINLTPADLRQKLVHKAYNSFEVGTFNIFQRKKEILSRTEWECWKTYWLRNVGNMEELSKKSLWYSKPPF